MPIFNKSAIMARVREAEAAALEIVAAQVVAEARRRAPVRKAFKEGKGHRRKFRSLTQAEVALATKRAVSYYTKVQPNQFKMRRAVSHIRNYARAERPVRGSANSLARSRQLRILGYERGSGFESSTGASRIRGGGFEPGAITSLLTSRGRNEARSGASIHREVLASGNVRVQIGGRLKASIESESVTQTGQGAEVRVTAGVRYAKFVEFPTIHNAAQPFLLPALHGNRRRLTETMRAEIAKTFGG